MDTNMPTICLPVLNMDESDWLDYTLLLIGMCLSNVFAQVVLRHTR